LLPDVGGEDDLPDYDAADVVSVLAKSGAADSEGKSGKHAGASLVVACIDALLLKLDSGMPQDVMNSAFVRRAFLPVLTATCEQLRSTDHRRLQLLQEIDALRGKLTCREDAVSKLDEMCDGVCRNRKFREAAEAVDIACRQSIKEKEELERDLQLLYEERQRLEQQLDEKRALQAAECAACDEMRAVLIGERDEQEKRRAELDTEVPEKENELRHLKDEALILSDACQRRAVEVQALPELEAELTEAQAELANLTAQLSQAKFNVEKAKGKLKLQKSKTSRTTHEFKSSRTTQDLSRTT